MMKKRKRIGSWYNRGWGISQVAIGDIIIPRNFKFRGARWGINYTGGSNRIVIRNPNIQITTYITVKQEVSRVIGKAKQKYTYLSDLETEKVYLHNFFIFSV